MKSRPVFQTSSAGFRLIFDNKQTILEPLRSLPITSHSMRAVIMNIKGVVPLWMRTVTLSCVAA